MEKKSHKTLRGGGIVAGGTGATTIGNTAVSATIMSIQQQPQLSAQAAPGLGVVGGTGVGGGSSGGGVGVANTKHRNSSSSHHHHNHHHSSSHHRQQQQQQQQHGHHHQSHATTTPTFTLAIGKSNNNSHHNTSAKMQNPAMLANTNAEHATAITAINPKTAVALRNKNEEAINDLRQRIPEIENIFDVHSRIGNGTFSTVLLGTLKKEREMPENVRRKFAIKHHIPTSHPDRIMKELQCMAKIGGTENVVGINCCIRYNESVAFIMPYMQHDRFHDFFNKMELSELQHYMKNLLIALRHVHKFNVIHRDVKPSNFLYNRRKRQFLLVDFGLAQQVPTPHMTGALESGCDTAILLTDGKRQRDTDDTTIVSKVSDASGGGGGGVGGNGSGALNDVWSSSKRLRCTGPHGDHESAATNATPNARVANSCIVGGSPFKMPLKQLNEITGGNGVGGSGKSAVIAGAASAIVTGSANNLNNGEDGSNGICEAPVSRQVKSAILGNSISSRGQQKMRSSHCQSPNTVRNVGAAETGATGSNAVAVPGADNSKYNTNRNLSTANSPKCVCYGNPQVCNICLIKKEIHASRAGTPGYRPPEVLLKYPDQTTAVDIWAAGVIFLSILSSVYPFFKAPNDFVALAEMVTIFGDKTIRKTAFILDRLVTLSQKTKPLDLRKLCVRFRNRVKFSSPELLKKYQRPDGTCEVCRNCDQFYFNCLCTETNYNTEPLDSDDPFPASAYDLLYKLLEVNPHQRITAEEALKHPFFSEINKTNSDTNINNNNNNNNNNNTNSIADTSTTVMEGAVHSKKAVREKVEL